MSEGSETPGTGKAPIEKTFNLDGEFEANKYGMGAISEVEGMDLIQSVADVLYNIPSSAFENREQAKQFVQGLMKLGNIGLGGAALGAAGTSLADAITYLMKKGQKNPKKNKKFSEK